MRAAEAVAFVNTVNGADLDTLTAARAKRIIDCGKVVYNLDCFERADLFALHTADTAVSAIFTGYSALVVIRAFDEYFGSIVDNMDN